jgi:hypothetical protein
VALTECDRRLHPRYTVQVQIELRLEGNDVPMRLATTDLSRAGLLPRADDAPLRRHSPSSTLWLDGHPIVIQGRVITCHPQYGNGMMFEKFESQGRTIPATVPGRHRHHDLAPRHSSNARFPIRTIGNVHPSPSGTSAASNST